MEQLGMDTAVPESIYNRSKINHVRAVNVIATDEIKALLLQRGTQIGRAELDNGIQADQALFQSFAEVYNATGRQEVDSLKYTIDWKGATPPDPSSFQPIDWKKAQAVYKEMGSKYDMAHKQWKRSGCHVEFDSVDVDQPFSDFTQSPWLIYMHQFIQANPGILHSVTSDLADGTHWESASGNQPSCQQNQQQQQSASSRKRKSASSDEQNDIFCSIAKSTEVSATANEAKSKAISFAAMTQSRVAVKQTLDDAKAKKKSSLASLKQDALAKNDPHCVRKIISNVNKKEWDKHGGDSDEDEDESSRPAFQLSQSTTASIRMIDSFDTAYDLAKEYNEASKDVVKYQKEVQSIETKIKTMNNE